MNKSSSQLSQVVGPQTIRHSVSIDKLNSFGPTDSTGRKAEHINLIIRDTHNQKEKEIWEKMVPGVRYGQLQSPLPSRGILWRREGLSLSAFHFPTPGFLSTLCPLSFLASLYWNCLAGSLALSAQFILHLCSESPKDLSLWNSSFSPCSSLSPFNGTPTPLIHSSFPNDQEW